MVWPGSFPNWAHTIIRPRSPWILLDSSALALGLCGPMADNTMMKKATMGAEAILMFGEGEVALRQMLRIAWACIQAIICGHKFKKTGNKQNQDFAINPSKLVSN